MKANTYSRRGGVGGKKASTAPAPADDDSFDDFVSEKKKPSGTGKKKNTCSAKGKSKNDKPQTNKFITSLDTTEEDGSVGVSPVARLATFSPGSSGSSDSFPVFNRGYGAGAKKSVKDDAFDKLFTSDGGGAKKKGLPFGGNQSSTFESSGEYRGGGACGGSSSTDGSWHTATGGSGKGAGGLFVSLTEDGGEYCEGGGSSPYVGMTEVTKAPRGKRRDVSKKAPPKQQPRKARESAAAARARMPKSTTTPPQIFGTRDVDRCGGNRPAFSNETLNYVVASVNDLNLNEGNNFRPASEDSDLARDFEEPLAKFRESLSGSTHELKLTGETFGDIVSKGDSARVVLKDIANHISSPANSDWPILIPKERNPAIPANEGDYKPSPIPRCPAVTNLPTYNSPMGDDSVFLPPMRSTPCLAKTVSLTASAQQTPSDSHVTTRRRSRESADGQATVRPPPPMFSSRSSGFLQSQASAAARQSEGGRAITGWGGMVMVAKGGKNWRRSVRQSVLNSGASTAASQKVQKITTRRRGGCGGSGGLINRVPQPHFNESLDLFDENDEENLEEDNSASPPLKEAPSPVTSLAAVSDSISDSEPQQQDSSPLSIVEAGDDPVVVVEKSVIPVVELTPLKSFRKTFTHHNRSASYIVPDDDEETVGDEEEHLTVEERLLERTSSKKIVDFSRLYPKSLLLKSKKVGEGSFGEVFLLANKSKSPPVLKVIPVDGPAPVNGQPQTKMADILAEIIASVELGRLSDFHSDESLPAAPSFVTVEKVELVRGLYPQALLQLWDQFDSENSSENDRPDRDLFSEASSDGVRIDPKEQLFVAIEFANGGRDLEHTKLKNATQGLSIFLQIAHALAVSERALEFEHRDLHWGNILVKECEANPEDTVLFRVSLEETYSVQSAGVLATVIDCSLSRLKLPVTSEGAGGKVVFNNLADDQELFTAHGDYQFDIYRKMQEANGDEWKSFNPRSNVFWLHYLSDKLISGEVTYLNKRSKAHKIAFDQLKRYHQTVLNSESSLEFVRSLKTLE